MIIVFATCNPHKVNEVSAILAPLGFDVRDLNAYSGLVEPVEDALTFAGNARIKACSYAAQCKVACLAEDSGLEVEVLGGRPGVHSARYSGMTGPRQEVDEANNTRLLQELQAVPWDQRGARFVSTFCLAQPDGTVMAEATGAIEGRIAREARGTNGFGYDPLFFIDDVGCTSAELPPDEKNLRSHRGQAARRLARILSEQREQSP